MARRILRSFQKWQKAAEPVFQRIQTISAPSLGTVGTMKQSFSAGSDCEICLQFRRQGSILGWRTPGEGEWQTAKGLLRESTPPLFMEESFWLAWVGLRCPPPGLGRESPWLTDPQRWEGRDISSKWKHFTRKRSHRCWVGKRRDTD